MKKNLHFVLALTLGLATTVSAQDWSVDSRTRVNSTEDATSTDQRVRTAVDFGGDAVSAHVELNSTATLGSVANEAFSLTVREAYATTNVMDFASVTAGRMALNFGSGRILGDNDWVNGNGNTWDGFLVGINNDFADIHVGYSTTKDVAQTYSFTDGFFADSNNYVFVADYEVEAPAYEATMMYVNVAKDMGAMSFNLLYVDSKEDVSGRESTSMGLDATYAMDNGVNLSLGYYTNDDGSEDGEMDLTSLGVSYSVNDDLSVHAGYDMYGENGFYLSTGSFGDMYGSGMEYSTFEGFEGTDMSFGGSYAMGNFMVGATMHTVTPEDETLDDYSVTDFSLGYTLSDNSSVSVNYASTDRTGEDNNKTWISLNIGF